VESAVRGRVKHGFSSFEQSNQVRNKIFTQDDEQVACGQQVLGPQMHLATVDDEINEAEDDEDDGGAASPRLPQHWLSGFPR